ncbi:MAG: hypothetical protein J0H49_02045 [Acidobacteria bacterium]|nr:hypothetical protein [Acidobacteriota bacterium]
MVVLLTWRGYALHPTTHKSENLVHWRERNARSRPYLLGKPHRKLILETIRKTCESRNYELLAAHIRTTHLHVILDAPSDPAGSMGTLKLECTKALKAANLATAADRIWANYGHIRILKSPYAITKAINYVLQGQGPPMETYRETTAQDSPGSPTLTPTTQSRY